MRLGLVTAFGGSECADDAGAGAEQSTHTQVSAQQARNNAEENSSNMLNQLPGAASPGSGHRANTLRNLIVLNRSAAQQNAEIFPLDETTINFLSDPQRTPKACKPHIEHLLSKCKGLNGQFELLASLCTILYKNLAGDTEAGLKAGKNKKSSLVAAQLVNVINQYSKGNFPAELMDKAKDTIAAQHQYHLANDKNRHYNIGLFSGSKDIYAAILKRCGADQGPALEDFYASLQSAAHSEE